MKILYLSNSKIASERANAVHVMKMCQAFSKSSCEMTLYAQEGDGDEASCFRQYGIDTKFELRRMKLSRFETRIIPSAISLPVRIVQDIKQSKIPFDFLFGRSKIALFLLRNKGEFMYESHMPPKNPLYFVLEKIMVRNRNFRGLVVISEALKKEYLRVMPELAADKILVLHDCADEVKESDSISGAELKKKQKVNVGYVGHLYPGKCMEILSALAEKMPDVLFHVVGGTDQWVQYWKEKTSDKKIENILFYGYVPNNEAMSYYKTFDIMVLPFQENVYIHKSKINNIGSWFSPLKLFETMSWGKPMLVSALPTIKEVIHDDFDGMLCNPNDIDEWKTKLESLIQDQRKREQLGQNARETFLRKYTWDQRAKTVLEYIK